MKPRLALAFLTITALSVPLLAQEKPGRKTMVFQPGAKTPDGQEAPPAQPPVEKSAFDLSSAEAPAQFALHFFTQLQKGDIDGAYGTLTKGSKISERPEELKALKSKTHEAIDVFGAVVGFEMVESKSVGERLLRRTYVSLGKEFPLRWRFYFYKPELVWRLVDLRVDDRLSGMFDEPDDSRAPDIKK